MTEQLGERSLDPESPFTLRLGFSFATTANVTCLVQSVGYEPIPEPIIVARKKWDVLTG